MSKQTMVVRRGQGAALNVLGANVRFLCEADDTARAWSVMEVQLPKDSGPPPHDHDWDEAYYVIGGDVHFTLGAETFVVSGGDFVYAPGGTLHGFRGASDAPARVLIFDAPAHAGSFFKEVDREVRNMPDDLSKVPGIGDRHGIRFRAPAGA